jgi:L-ribulose-5-phosphate 4-epimerase
MKTFLFLLTLISVTSGCREKPDTEIADREYKDILIEVAKRGYDRGLYWGTGGDISVRVAGTDRFIIKASMTCMGDLDYSKLVTVDLSGDTLEGGEPSHETAIHREIYKMRPNVGAILHMHSPFATAWGCVGKTIPPVTQQSVTLFKDMGIVPFYPVGSDDLVNAVSAKYETPTTQVVLMENHGTFVVGNDLYSLLYNAEKVENTAKIAYIANSLGTVKEFEAIVVY